MTTELKKGYYIDSYYDKYTKSYITTIKDNESNQIGDAAYSGNMTDRNADIQYFKEIFYDPMKWEDFKSDSYDNAKDDLNNRTFINDEISVEESLENKIKDTKNKTKKSKLPALSTLSPIMPDAAAGIDTFNSGVGLSEEWLYRDELESRLKKMGFRYKFNKYTDEQLYKIYQERLKYLEKKKKEKQRQKQKDDEQENKRVNSKDSFMKNGIEFESEDAAREYFGESMENKFYLNDMHEAWDLEETTSIKKSLNESLNESVADKIKITYRKSGYGGFTAGGDDIDIDSYSTKFENIEGSTDSRYALILLQSNISWSDYSSIIFSDDLQKCKTMAVNWLAGKYTKFASEPMMERHLYAMIIDLEKGTEIAAGDSWQDTEKISKGWREFSLNESLNQKNKFKTVTEGLKYFERKAFDESCEAPELELLYEGVKNSLDSEDIKKLGNFINKASNADEITTYIKGLLTEDIDNFDINDCYKLAEDISNYADKEWNIWHNDVYDVDLLGDTVEIKFIIKGDWKHDHLKFEYAVGDYLREKHPDIIYNMWEEEVDSDDEYESDYYPSVHVLSLKLDENGELQESLNESYIEEWWGQTDEDPHELENFGLKVTKLDRKADETLYRFEGRRSDIERAMDAGYFYSFEYGEDAGHSKDLEKTYGKLVDELVAELNKVGFELDSSLEHPVRNNIMGGKHIQVINPTLKYPSAETEGEDLSEEEAYKLFKDDVKEITYILDKFEEDNDIALTFNFGPNKDMIITGGIDIR